jgi:hypothetical protein
LAAAALPAATFNGTITDDMCKTADHKAMNMGTDAKCVEECIKGMNGKYLLYDGKESYNLSGAKIPVALAAKKVTVTGNLDAKTKTIRVEKIEAAQ